MKSLPPQSKTWDRRSHLFMVAGLVVLGFALGGSKFINALEQGYISDHYAVLDTIARTKTDQLLAWRSERLADARMNSSGLIKTLTQDWYKTGSPQALADITLRMETFRENEGYHNMILADTSGNILVSLIAKTEHHQTEAPTPRQQQKQLEPEENNLLAQVLSSRQATLGDFYYCHTCKRTHINAAAPVMDKGNQPIAVLLLVTDPEENLFPMLFHF